MGSTWPAGLQLLREGKLNSLFYGFSRKVSVHVGKENRVSFWWKEELNVSFRHTLPIFRPCSWQAFRVAGQSLFFPQPQLAFSYHTASQFIKRQPKNHLTVRSTVLEFHFMMSKYKIRGYYLQTLFLVLILAWVAQFARGFQFPSSCPWNSSWICFALSPRVLHEEKVFRDKLFFGFDTIQWSFSLLFLNPTSGRSGAPPPGDDERWHFAPEWRFNLINLVPE